MYVECCKNNGVDYLRLVKSQRVLNATGIKTARKKTILNIGPLSRFDDGKPDYVERLKKSYKAGQPLIPALKPYCETEPSPEKYNLCFTEGSSDCIGHPKLCAQLLLERILEEIGLHALVSSCKGFTKMQYDVYGFFKLLVFGRILNPDSKIATTRQNDNYYDPILGQHNPDNIYDTLDFIYRFRKQIIRRINTNLVKKAGRTPDLIYYDVTNFYFEIEEPDEDTVAEDNSVVPGFRKYGICKEERKSPIVQMAMFMDSQGIPVAVLPFQGNIPDALSLKPALKEHIDDMNFSRYVMVADRGICQYANLLYLLDSGHGYIVAKSILKSPADEQKWTYDEHDYIHCSEKFKYKSRIVKRIVQDDNGAKREIEEKVVVYWSKNFQDRAEREQKSFLDFLEKLEKNPDNFRVTSMQAKKLRCFMKRNMVNKKTGEEIKSSDLRPLIDFDKIREYRRNLGYYQIITSELVMNPLEVIDKYHGLTQIEDQFRVMKGTFDTRPIFVRNSEHIIAHLIVCFIALAIVRIIQKRLKDSRLYEKKEELYWYNGLSADRIKDALNKWTVDALKDDYYRFNNVDDPDLANILAATNIDIQRKLYQRGDLKGLKSKMKIFM